MSKKRCVNYGEIMIACNKMGMRNPRLFKHHEHGWCLSGDGTIVSYPESGNPGWDRPLIWYAAETLGIQRHGGIVATPRFAPVLPHNFEPLWECKHHAHTLHLAFIEGVKKKAPPPVVPVSQKEEYQPAFSI